MLSSWIFEFANLFLKNEKSAAFLSGDGEVLHAKSDLDFEVTGFKNIAENSLKYISLKPGEILVTNDPYSGGSFLYRYTFLMPLQSGLFLCVRREFSPGLNFTDKLDNEGLRIPPTPIFQGNQVATPILEAIGLHPLCPQGFNSWLQKTIEDLGAVYKKWQQVEKTGALQLNSNEFKKFLNFSRDFATEKILEKAQGEGRAEVRLDSGEVLKLRLEIHNGLVKADFSGTTPGIKTHIPESATFGACYEALSQFYKLNCLKNSGTFSILQITKPIGCFLNAKYPASTYRGCETGVAAVRLAMTLALREIVKSTAPMATECSLKLEMSFAENKRWLSSWSPKNCCESISLEGIESDFPIQFSKLEKSAEDMHFEIEFKTLAACQIRWLMDLTKNPPSAPKGLKAPAPARIETLNSAGEWIPLPPQGNTDLAPGTHLRVNLWGLYT